MSPYAKNTIFAAVDVTHLWREQKVLAGEIFSNVMGQICGGVLNPCKLVIVELFSRFKKPLD